MMSAMDEGVKRIIERVVRDRLNDDAVRILDVKIEEDTDFDGDTVYRVMVIFDNSKGRLDAKKTAGLVRHTRSNLAEKEIDNFPIFRFVSQSDARKLGSAAA